MNKKANQEIERTKIQGYLSKRRPPARTRSPFPQIIRTSGLK